MTIAIMGTVSPIDDNDDISENAAAEGEVMLAPGVEETSNQNASSGVGRWQQFRSSRRFRPIITVVSAILAVVVGIAIWGVIEAQKVAVPDLVGLAVADIDDAIGEIDLLASATSALPSDELQSFTRITSQDPAAESRVFSGSAVTYTYELVSVNVPQVEGKTRAEAGSMLGAAGLMAESSHAQLLILEPDATGLGLRSVADPATLKSILDELGVSGDVDLTGEVFKLEGTATTNDWVVLTADPPAGKSMVAGSTVALTLGLPLTEVPNVIGMKYSDALASLEAAGIDGRMNPAPVFDGGLPPEFKLDIEYLEFSYWSGNELDVMTQAVGNPEAWPVVSQSTPAAQIVQAGQTIQLTGAWPSTTVPDLSRMTSEQARQALHDAGLSWHDMPSTATGVVQSQSYAPGVVMPMGSRVTADIRHEVTFAVTSSAGTGMVTWAAPGTFSIEQANGARLPWSNTWLRASAPGPYDRGNFNAQMNAWDGWITCEILVDGNTVVSNTSTGAFAVVSCG